MLPNNDESQVKPEEKPEEKKKTKCTQLTPEEKKKLWDKYGHECVGHPDYENYIRSQVIAGK